jgi:hypothetical protein
VTSLSGLCRGIPDVSANLTVVIFRVNYFVRGFDSCYIALALRSLQLLTHRVMRFELIDLEYGNVGKASTLDTTSPETRSHTNF